VHKNNCDVLAFTGGGSYGAVEIGILDSLNSNRKIPEQFDVVTGISAGALNAAFLSYYPNISHAIPDLKEIMSNLNTSSVYHRDYLNIFSRWSFYNNKPLENTIRNIISSKLQFIAQSERKKLIKTKTLIGATNVNEELLDVFEYNNLELNKQVDVLMATTSIPIIFPPREIDGKLYIDGGIISNEMIFQAFGSIKCNHYSIVVISASPRGKKNNIIQGFFSYIHTITGLIFDTFDYQLAEFISIHCKHPIGTILLCYPDSDELKTISILDFDKGNQLYDIGKNHNKCEKYDVC
jgi:predicted acylesterase/phospholipase RssA